MDGAHCLVKNVEQMKLLPRVREAAAGKEAVNTPLGRQLRHRHHERREETRRGGIDCKVIGGLSPVHT